MGVPGEHPRKVMRKKGGLVNPRRGGEKNEKGNYSVGI